MIEGDALVAEFAAAGVGLFTGVPDSVLGGFCHALQLPPWHQRHQVAANEGGAVGLAIGHYLGSGRVPLVYLQNSGLGNAANPLISLAHADVYGVPMVMLIGWRGAPGVADEPQHVAQGGALCAQLASMGIEWFAPQRADEVLMMAAEAVALASARAAPVALLVTPGLLAKSQASPATRRCATLSRADVIEIMLTMAAEARVVATTGMASRELYQLRLSRGETDARDFLCVGGMGHASQVALGLALAQPDLPVVCLDGDGAALMHLGGLAAIGASGVREVIHIVLHDGMHSSVGGQPTVAPAADLAAIARACGYVLARRVHNGQELRAAYEEAVRAQGPSLLDVQVTGAGRTGLGRPESTPAQRRDAFMSAAGSL